MGNRRRWIAAATVLLLLALWLWKRGGDTETAKASVTPPSSSAGQGQSSQQPHLPSSKETGGEGRVVIDAIDVEKPEVCAGEEDLITVHAHTVRPSDSGELQIRVDGIEGDRVALRPNSYKKPDGGPPQVTAFTDPAHPVVMTIPEFRVNPCRPERIVEVVHRPVSNLPDRMEFWARVNVVSAPTKPFQAVRYRWDFGDGTTSITTTPIVEKSFRERRQESLKTTFLVSCTVEGVDGSELMGRDAFVMLNQAYENLSRKKIVILEFDKPRFPEPDASGTIEFPVRIWHHHDSPVTITEIHLRRVEREGVESEVTMPVEPLLHTTTIPPTGITITAHLDKDDKVLYLLYRLVGVTEEGLKVAGEFSVMRPTDLPTPEHHTPVVDPVLMSKIMQAQKILGRKYVTDEDIWKLEREGKLGEPIDPSKLPQKMPEIPVGPKGAGNQQPSPP